MSRCTDASMQSTATAASQLVTLPACISGLVLALTQELAAHDAATRSSIQRIRIACLTAGTAWRGISRCPRRARNLSAQLLAAAAASTAAPKLEPSAVGLNWISRVSSLAREPEGSGHTQQTTTTTAAHVELGVLQLWQMAVQSIAAAAGNCSSNTQPFPSPLLPKQLYIVQL
jgi:hypothetical protein